MQNNAEIEARKFEDIPLNCDIYLMGETWLDPYKISISNFINGEEYEYVGYVSFASVKSIGQDYAELSWYPNIHDRFHRVAIVLPRSEFITCLELQNIDEKPRIFVTDNWLYNIHTRSHSVFAMVDTIGMKKAMKNGTLTMDKLSLLREQVDSLSVQNSNFAFVSFADSLLIKANWTVGHIDSEIGYTYNPESILHLIPKIQKIYKEIMSMNIYTIITQGANEYYGNELFHVSGNHFCLNSLGLSFSQLKYIEEMARGNIRKNIHPPKDLYIDENYFHSLRFTFEFFEEKNKLNKYQYRSPVADMDSHYYAVDCRNILQNLVQGAPIIRSHDSMKDTWRL